MVNTTERSAEPRQPMRFEKTTNMRVSPQQDALPPGHERLGSRLVPVEDSMASRGRYPIRAVCTRMAYSHPKRPGRSSLLPPGEGGRDGRMRGPGPHRSGVLRREAEPTAKAPHPPLRGTFSRGEKGAGSAASATRWETAPTLCAGVRGA